MYILQNSHLPLDGYKPQRKTCVILQIPTNNHLALHDFKLFLKNQIHSESTVVCLHGGRPKNMLQAECSPQSEESVCPCATHTWTLDGRLTY